MNYSKAFSYMFQDDDWFAKLLVAGLIALIPVAGPLYLLGWSIEIIRRVRAGRMDLLPRTHFWEFIKMGLSNAVLNIFFLLPAYLVTGFTRLMQNAAETRDNVGVFALAILCVLTLAGILIAYVMSFMLMVGRINYAKTGNLKSCLYYSQTFQIVKANWQLLAVVALMEIVAGMVGALGVIFCFIGILFTAPYAAAVSSHMLGQVWGLLTIPDMPAPRSSVRGASSGSSDVMEAPVAPVRTEPKNEWVDPVLNNEPFEGEIVAEPAADEPEPAPETAAPDEAPAAEAKPETPEAPVSEDAEEPAAAPEEPAAPDVIFGEPPADPAEGDEPIPPFE